MVFDFNRRTNRDVIESVAILAGLSHFVIADLTEPKIHAARIATARAMLGRALLSDIRRGDRVFSMFADLQPQVSLGSPAGIYRGRSISFSC